MSILSGFLKTKKYRKKDDGNYQLQSEWTSSETVEMADGNTLETNLGSIKGITSSLSSTSANYALSASAGKSLQNNINTLNTNLKDYVIIKSVKIYATTTIVANSSGQIYFAVPTIKGYKCLLGIGGAGSNNYITPISACNIPKDDGTLVLNYNNNSSNTQTVDDLYCLMIFIRDL